MNTGRILIVDDNPSNCKLLTTFLTAEQYRCDTAQSGDMALSMMPHFKPDLVLLDIMMPGMDGFEVAREIRKNQSTQHVPIIMLTALCDRESRINGLDAGADDFLNKPFDQLELRVRIRNLLKVKEYQDFLLHHNELLDQQVRVRTQELWETRLDIVRSLGRAAEYRDNETGMHIIRMSKFSQALALASGESEQWAELLLNASPMHDIGKVGIPDHILLKPGKLTAEEWQVMQTHAAIGAEILQAQRPSELSKMASRIAIGHHEKWDGSGYPNGLAGEAIPLEARIVALADVFDALTSERPYKKAWPIDEAVSEIKKLSGSHFQPELVVAFLAVLADVLKIREEHIDVLPIVVNG
ncbi:MAG: two-component system response regulator [Gammaproteobacteria bacterium]|nr:two-component system response regulator [Gammaproteobacteria bacterium]